MAIKREGVGVSVGRFIDRNWPVFLSGITTLALVFYWPIFESWDSKSWQTAQIQTGGVILIPILVLYAGYILNKRVLRVDEIETENRRLKSVLEAAGINHEALWRIVLQEAFDELKLTDTHRVSLYRHRPNRNSFQMIGRYSSNPIFDQKGRTFYPDHEGCIAEAWRLGEHIGFQLPDPNTDIDLYCQRTNERWGMPIDTARDLLMKSRAFVACAIKDPSNYGRICVIVFESMSPRGLQVRKIRDLIAGANGSRISRLADLLKSTEPQITIAQDKGF